MIENEVDSQPEELVCDHCVGLGLLYIADEIVAAHGGTIAVESSQENGTTFTIRVPKRAESRAA